MQKYEQGEHARDKVRHEGCNHMCFFAVLDRSRNFSKLDHASCQKMLGPHVFFQILHTYILHESRTYTKVMLLQLCPKCIIRSKRLSAYFLITFIHEIIFASCILFLILRPCVYNSYFAYMFTTCKHHNYLLVWASLTFILKAL